MMSMRKQMDESNLEIVNTLTQQMGTIFNPLITNANKTYKLLANQMGRIADSFGTPQVLIRPTPQISNVRHVEMPGNVMAQVNLGQHQGFRSPEQTPNRKDEEYIG